MGQTKTGDLRKTPQSNIGLTKALMIAACSLMAALRVIALESDAYSHLSYSSALLTDEGFYIHNARNIALFGRAVTDQFNNMLIMPTLHQLQVWVFSVWGVGAIQARAISVAASLIMLAIIYIAVRRCFGTQIACFSLLFLGLGHANLLYNRMALMDTPAALGLVCVFVAWVYGVHKTESGQGKAAALFGLSGLIIAVTYATRGLTAWIVPIPFALLLYRARMERGAGKQIWVRAILSQSAGLAFGILVYLLGWYLPHHRELGEMTRYYVTHQMLPHSVNALRENITHALVGDTRGISPYLFRHSPVEFALTLGLLLACALNLVRSRIGSPGEGAVSPAAGFAAIFSSREDKAPQARLSEMAAWFLIAWLLLAWITDSLISYSPDRYYVLFYPAMAIISAIAVSRPKELHEAIGNSWTLAVLIGFLSYHAGEAILHHSHDLALGGIVFVASGIAALFIVLQRGRKPLRFGYSAALPLLIWAAVNTCWTSDWLRHLSYVRSHADSWLEHTLPANSVLIGDVAPGLCMDNRFTTVNVIPGLCNDSAPLEKFADRQRYVVILDERFLERYWIKQYPQVITYDRRISIFPSIIKFPVGIYRVGNAPGPGGYSAE